MEEVLVAEGFISNRGIKDTNCIIDYNVSLSAQGKSGETNKRASTKIAYRVESDARVEPLAI